MSERHKVDEDMDDQLEDMIRDIGEDSFRKIIFMIFYVVIRMKLYIRGAQVLHNCLQC